MIPVIYFSSTTNQFGGLGTVTNFHAAELIKAETLLQPAVICAILRQLSGREIDDKIFSQKRTVNFARKK